MSLAKMNGYKINIQFNRIIQQQQLENIKEDINVS